MHLDAIQGALPTIQVGAVEGQESALTIICSISLVTSSEPLRGKNEKGF